MIDAADFFDAPERVPALLATRELPPCDVCDATQG